MENIIEVRNLSFGYKNKIFNKISFSIEKYSWMSFYGNNSSGMSTLVSILCDDLNADGYINVNHKYLCSSTKKLIKEDVYSVNYDSISCFVGISLYDELILSGNKDIDDYIMMYGLAKYKYERFNNIPLDKKIIVSILYGVLKKYRVILLDNVLCYLSKNDKREIYSLLTKNKITVCNFTSNPEELLFGEKVILMKNFECVPTSSIQDIKIVDFCNKLNCYGLIDNISLDIDEVIEELW